MPKNKVVDGESRTMMGDFNILGSEIEPNGSGDGIVDLNDGAGGEYIYLYVSRNHQIRPLLEGIYIDSLDYVTSGNHRTDPDNLNHGAGGYNDSHWRIPRMVWTIYVVCRLQRGLLYRRR